MLLKLLEFLICRSLSCNRIGFYIGDYFPLNMFLEYGFGIFIVQENLKLQEVLRKIEGCVQRTLDGIWKHWVTILPHASHMTLGKA